MNVVMFLYVDQDLSNAVANIAMYGTEDNNNLPFRCPTASKLTHGVSTHFITSSLCTPALLMHCVPTLLYVDYLKCL